jgi:hypothetical protein
MDFTKYENKLEYPKGHSKPYLEREDQYNEVKVAEYAKELKKYKDETPAYNEARAKYSNETCRLEEIFRSDALKEVGLEGHECADRAYSYAWEQGHSCGYSEVFNYLLDIAEVILGWRKT